MRHVRRHRTEVVHVSIRYGIGLGFVLVVLPIETHGARNLDRVETTLSTARFLFVRLNFGR